MLKKRLGLEAIERDYGYIKKMGVVSDYYKISSSLIIPEGCVRIGVEAFKNCWWLEKVIIPESVEWIECSAFCNCWKATVILEKPESEFKEIGEFAFWGQVSVNEKARRSRSWRKRLALFWNKVTALLKKIC